MPIRGDQLQDGIITLDHLTDEVLDTIAGEDIQVEQWHSQAGAPAAITGAIGDWSLDSTSGNFYEKTGVSAWTLRGNLKGPQGEEGIPGIQGDQGPQGEPGEIPAVDAWTPVTFNTGWVNFDGGFAGAAYYKDPFGVVHLKGLVKRTSGTNTTIFTLPSGYRPAASATRLFVVHAYDGATAFTEGRVDVTSTGAVTLILPGTIGVTGYIGLDGIHFRP